MKLGASGDGRFSCVSSMPLPVTTNTASPTTSGEHAAMLCGKTFSRAIMSNDQITSASVGPLFHSPWNPWLPLANPSTSRHTTSARLLT